VRILVVDDNVDTAEVLGELLQIWGHEVHLAQDGRSALEAAGQLRPDAVLLDLGLPGMDGCEVARALRRRPELAQIVLVALTGYGGQEDLLRAQEAGFDRYWTKPVDLAGLRAFLAGFER
jgi:CheY-like chemotaxis protein